LQGGVKRDEMIRKRRRLLPRDFIFACRHHAGLDQFGAAFDSIPGVAEASPMTHVEALELDRIPDHLLVIGGGYVGLELAQTMHRFGSRVTILERNDALVHHEDRDVSEAIHELFTDEGIEIRTGVQVNRVEGRSGVSMQLVLTRDGTEDVVEGSDLLLASGRTPNTDGICWKVRVLNETKEASFELASAFKLQPQGYGRSAIVQAALNSHTSPTMMSAWCVKILPGEAG
jgi:Pyridine nucleotide-disulphide oxidoreductase